MKIIILLMSLISARAFAETSPYDFMTDGRSLSFHGLFSIGYNFGGQAINNGDNSLEPLLADAGATIGIGFITNLPNVYLQWENTVNVSANLNGDIEKLNFPVESTLMAKLWENFHIGGGVKVVPPHDIILTQATSVPMDLAIGGVIEARYQNWNNRKSTGDFYISVKGQFLEYSSTAGELAPISANSVMLVVGTIF